MVTRNKSFTKLKENYLFPEIESRAEAYKAQNPGSKLLSLGIGDTTEPLPAVVSKALAVKSAQLGTKEGFRGYGPSFGSERLREKIADQYGGRISPKEVYLSDGAKCDVGRLQLLFGDDVQIALQDPTYPVYHDSALLIGQKPPILLPCTPDNDFFPDLRAADLIYFCSPNNPTGTVATKEQLQTLVEFALKNGSIIIFDAAYSAFVQDPKLPRSIFEIEGAKEVAIEINSFSKSIGYTGVRLGWSVVPHSLRFQDGSFVYRDWERLLSTLFNGPSNVAEAGALAALTPEGMRESEVQIQAYLQNAFRLKSVLSPLCKKIYGGVHAPYLWADFGAKQDSWQLFDHFLHEFELITTPGSGFGGSGRGFLRFSAFGSAPIIQEATMRLTCVPSL